MSELTATIICTEALRRFLNGGDPTPEEITRAIDYGMEKIKRDIMGIGKTWRPLLRSAYAVTSEGVADYANPSTFEAHLSVGLMTGVHTGLLRNVGSATTVTLAIDEDITEAEIKGRLLLLTSGQGANQAALVSAYNTTTKICTLTGTGFITLPEIGTGYMAVKTITDLRKMDVGRYDQFEYPGVVDTPTRYVPVPDDTVGYISLYPTPDAAYGIRRRYYADLLKVDTEGTLYSTLLQRWAAIFEQGIYVWKLQEDDDRYDAQNAIYQQMLINLQVTDLDGFVPPQKSEGE